MSSPEVVITINKVFALRGLRDDAAPSVEDVVSAIRRGGCSAVSIHIWPDNRHVALDDLPALRDITTREQMRLVVGGLPTPELTETLADIRPDTFTAAPFRAAAKTTEQGWSPENPATALLSARDVLRQRNVQVGAFIDPDPRVVRWAGDIGLDHVELGCRILRDSRRAHSAVTELAAATTKAHTQGLKVHLAHELRFSGVATLAAAVPADRIVLGYHEIAAALVVGLETVAKRAALAARAH